MIPPKISLKLRNVWEKHFTKSLHFPDLNAVKHHETDITLSRTKLTARWTSRHYLIAQSQQQKYLNNVGNLLRVHNKDTRTMSVTSFWCLFCQLWTDFTHCSGVSINSWNCINSFKVKNGNTRTMCDLFQPYHKHTETTWNDHRNDVVRFFFISLEQISRTVLLLTVDCCWLWTNQPESKIYALNKLP